LDALPLGCLIQFGGAVSVPARHRCPHMASSAIADAWGVDGAAEDFLDRHRLIVVTIHVHWMATRVDRVGG
jgi:hypothetical protein